MLPDRCSVKQSGKDCVNPPEYLIEIVHGDDSYMVGITCEKHKGTVSSKIAELQMNDKVPQGKLQFEKLKSVGTDCVRTDVDEFIQLD